MPEITLKALATYRHPFTILPADGGRCEEILAQFTEVGIDLNELSARLQNEGIQAFVRSWKGLMQVISSTSADLRSVA
jgi:transaldolase